MTLSTRAGGDGEAESEEEAQLATDLFRAIGRQVKLLRVRAGLTQRELAERLGYSYDQIVSVESGRRTPQPEFLDAADDLLNAGGLLKTTRDDVLRAKNRARVRHPAWFRDYARLEAMAVELHEFSTHAIPGLFQTEAYTRALFAMRKPLLDEETLERRVLARLARQEILSQWPAPIVSTVIEESVVRRPIGGWEVHRQQLEHLLCVAEMRSIEVQIMPTEREEHAGVGGPFILVTPKNKAQVGYLEVQNVSRLVSDREGVRVLAMRYGSIRGQALTPRESRTLIEKILGER